MARVSSRFPSTSSARRGTIATSTATATRARGCTSAPTASSSLYGTLDAMRRLGAGRARRRHRADAPSTTPPAARSSVAEGAAAVMAIDDLLDRARDARRRRDEAAGELVALVRALEGLEGVGMLDGTQKRELGRLRERPRAKHNGGRRAAKRASARDRVTAVSSGAGAARLAGAGGRRRRRPVALAGRARRCSRWRCSRGGCSPASLGAARRRRARGWVLAGVLVLAPVARAAGADAARAAAAAPLPARLDRRRPAAGRARAAAARCRPARSPRSACASGGSIEDLDARRERLAASIGLRELRVTRDPADASRGTVTFVRRDPLAGTSSVPWPHAERGGAVVVGAGAGRRRRARPGRLDRAGGAQRAPGRRAGRRQVRRAVAAGRIGGAGSVGAAVAAGRQAGRAVGVGAVRATPRRPRRRRGDRAAARAARGDGAALPRPAGLAARARSRRERRAAAAPGGVRRARVLPQRRGPQATHRVRRAAARPRRPRPRRRGDRVRRDAEAGAPTSCPSALRDLFGFRLALRCNTPQASDTILGQGWASSGSQRRARSRPGSAASGCCWPRTGCPVRVRGFHLDDEDVATIAERASALRADALARRGEEQRA